MKMKILMQAGLLILLTAGMYFKVEGGNDRTSPRLVGMARANTAVAWGVDAAGINPALLSVNRWSSVEVNILRAGFLFGSNFMDSDLYSTYFTGVDDPVTGERVAKHLTPDDKNKILNSFPNGTGKINTDAQVAWFGAAVRTNMYGAVAFTVSDRFSMNFTMPNDYMRLLLEGFSEFGSMYDFSGTDAQSWWIREYSFSYATPKFRDIGFLQWITFGVGLKRVSGYVYFGTESYEGYISNEDLDGGFVLSGSVNMNVRRASANFIHDPDAYEFSPVGDPAGSGWGFDAGIAAGITENIIAGLSITDIGSIRWTENTYGTTADASVEIDDIFSEEQRDSLENAYTGTDETIAPFSTSMPAAIRAGISWQKSNNLLIAADYTQGLNTMPANTTTPRFAVGVEWKLIRYLPLRSGMSVGGYAGFAWSLGFGLHIGFFNIEVATENIGLLLYPNKTKHASVTVGTNFRF